MARFTPPLSPFPKLREIAERVNAILRGKINSHGTVTLGDSSATETTLTDERIGLETKVFLFPQTANAAAFMTGLYHSATVKGEATLTHAANTETDRTYSYLLIG